MLLTHEGLYKWADRLTQRPIGKGTIYTPILTIGLHFNVELGYKIHCRPNSFYHDIRDYTQESDRCFSRVLGAVGGLWRSQ